MKAAVVDSLRRKRLYAVLGSIGLLVVTLLATISVAGCGGGDGTSNPSAIAGGIQRGGVLKVGMQAGNGQWDPALSAGSAADLLVQAQVLERLVKLAPDFTVQPVLAKEWKSADSKVWTFNLQEGVSFTNGEAFTADDVVYTMNRLRSKKLGSPMADVYANITDVKAEGLTTVVFTLKNVNSEFPASLTDYRTLMLCRSVKDPMKEFIGTGPFMFKSFAAEDRAVLKANPEYWGKDADGNRLPYLDEIDVIFSPEVAGQVEGLQGGSLNWVGGLAAEQCQVVQANPGLKLLTNNSNSSFELQIRCDQGLGENLKFRQALMAGTDRQAIVDLVSPGVAVPGNGTLVGPAYKAYYIESPVHYDPERATQLLAEAGYGNGVKLKIVASSAAPIPAIATAWQAQMKKIGIDVEIRQVPEDVFYADQGNDNWYQADFGVVEWATRAAPTTYFALALTGDAPWNYSRWKNAKFDSIVKQIPLELDEARRADLYKQAQEILIDEAPMINILVNKATAAETSTLDGITLGPDWNQTTFSTAHFTK